MRTVNADFCAHARTHYPRALATIQKVQEEKEALITGLYNIHKFLTLEDCDRESALGMATSAVSSLDRRFKLAEQEIDRLAAENAALRHDIEAYRGALGYAIPCSHDGTLSDGTTPKNGLAEALSTHNRLLKTRIIELENSIANHFHREHLEGDGPKIDRLERENAALREEVARYEAMWKGLSAEAGFRSKEDS